MPLLLLPLFGYYAAITENVADDPVFIVVGCLLIGCVFRSFSLCGMRADSFGGEQESDGHHVGADYVERGGGYV